MNMFTIVKFDYYLIQCFLRSFLATHILKNAVVGNMQRLLNKAVSARIPYYTSRGLLNT